MCLRIPRFGLLLFEILHERRAFEESIPLVALMSSIEGKRPSLDVPAHLDSYAQLVASCWNKSPEQRPSMAEVSAALNCAI